MKCLYDQNGGWLIGMIDIGCLDVLTDGGISMCGEAMATIVDANPNRPDGSGEPRRYYLGSALLIVNSSLFSTT